MKAYLENRIRNLRNAFPDEKQMESLFGAIQLLREAIKRGGKLLACGNGGSAADAQHIVAEFVVKYKNNRRPYPAIALSVDTSVLTACANDFGFEHVFERQVKALGKENDVLLAISTSGRSKNVNLAVKAAKEIGLKVIYMTGSKKPEVSDLCDIILTVNSSETPIIQEIHRVYGHLLVELFEYMEEYL